MKIIKPSVELIDDINPDAIYRKIELCGRVCHQSEPTGNPESFIYMLIKHGHESVLEHVSLTFHITCDRAIQNELVRHRLASFSVESTRYVKYDELTFIKPCDWDEDNLGFLVTCNKEREWEYHVLTQRSIRLKPEQASAVLPLCLKSELYMTANLREWRHILKLRTDKAAHPQMRFIANSILHILKDKLPVIFSDLHEDLS